MPIQGGITAAKSSTMGCVSGTLSGDKKTLEAKAMFLTCNRWNHAIIFFCILMSIQIGMLDIVTTIPAFGQSGVPADAILTALKQNDLTKALDAAEKWIAQQPDNGNAWLTYTTVLVHCDAMEKALNAVLRAEGLLTNKQDQATLWFLKGDAHRALGNTDDAAKAYITAQNIGIDNRLPTIIAVSNEKMAALDYAKEQYPIALREYQDALALEKDALVRATLRTAIAHVYCKQKKFDIAMQALNKDATASPTDHELLAEGLICKGEILADSGRFTESDTIIQKGIKESRLAQDSIREVHGLRAIGYLYLRQGNRAIALLKFRKAFDLARTLTDKDLKQELEGRCAELQDSDQKTFGAIDMGAKGIKGVLMDYYKENHQPKLKEVDRIAINTDLLSAIDANHAISPVAMSKTVDAILTIAKSFRDKRVGVKITSITVGGSSSLTQATNLETLRNLINQGIQGMERGDPVNVNCNLRPSLLTKDSFLTSADELYYGILGSMPNDKIWDATLLDIGSGNGRIGYITQDEKGLSKTNVDIVLGTTTLTTAALRLHPNESYESALDKTVTLVTDKLHKTIGETPGLNNRKDIFLIGGAAWAMTTFIHPDQVNDGYVDIALADIDKFYDLMRQNRTAEYTPDFSAISDVNTRTKAMSELTNVRKTFTPDNLLSAALLLKTVRDSGVISDQKLHYSRFGTWSLGLAEAEYINHQLTDVPTP